MAQDTHAFIRSYLSSNVSADVANSTRILYGGSVKGSNCVDLIKQSDIDGFLVGGASLTEDMIQIVTKSQELA
jgi:triosephosphate isomerase